MNINCGGDRVPPTTSSIPLFLPTVHGVDLPWFPLLWFCDVGVKRSCLILCWWRIKPDQPRARKTRHILADVFLMILAELRQYLSQHKRVALVDLSCHFEIEAEALRGMLNTLEHKGWEPGCRAEPAVAMAAANTIQPAWKFTSGLARIVFPSSIRSLVASLSALPVIRSPINKLQTFYH